jgi:protein TonB
MTFERDRYFFYGGIFSLSFFSFLLLLILWKSSVEEKTVLFAANLGEVISVSLSDAPVVMDSVAVADSQPQVDEPQESVSPKELFIPETKREEKEEPVEIGDLFSTVKSTKTVTKKQDNSAQLKELTDLENKIVSSKRDSKLFDKVNKLDFAKPSVQMVASGSTGPEVNGYYAKVQGLVYANFHPATGTEGFKARVRIALSKEGKLESYKVVSYSSNGIFNAEVDWLKERLRQVDLPSHPQGQDAVFEIILSAKDSR